jgi:hypothetical protein
MFTYKKNNKKEEGRVTTTREMIGYPAFKSDTRGKKERGNRK